MKSRAIGKPQALNADGRRLSQTVAGTKKRSSKKLSRSINTQSSNMSKKKEPDAQRGVKKLGRQKSSGMPRKTPSV